MMVKKTKPSAAKKTSGQGPLGLTQSGPEQITTGLDPALQEIILRAREGKKTSASVAHALPEGTVVVDVIAKLSYPDRPVDGLTIVRRIGSIVTGQVAVEDIEGVRQHENVVSLKCAAPVYPELEFSVNEILATPEQTEAALPEAPQPLDGKGVIVGIVDYGCDFRHNNFRRADGSSRLLCLWDQRGGESSISPVGFDYGREFETSALDAALQETNPYQALMYDPGSSAHGTHVMDIAAGNGRATGSPGVAPGADLIFVNLAHDDIDLIDDPASGRTSSFGNSKMLLEAVDYIFSKAAAFGRPAVVNLSVGTSGGPHDGSTLAEQGFDELLQQPGRAITVSAGNSHQRRSHAQGQVTDASPRVLTWEIHDEDDTNNELEIWYPGDGALEVALETPSGQRLSPVRLGTSVTLTAEGTTVGRIIHRASDPNNHDNHVDVILDASLSGSWRLHLVGTMADPVSFHAWIERDFPSPDRPDRQSRFSAVDDDPSHTLGSIACSEHTIVVGSYLSGDPAHDLSRFSSEGPTRDGRQKPEVSAPGQFLHPSWEKGIRAARSRSQGTTRKSGTSMASPHVAGLIALVMHASDDLLTTDDIRRALIEAARRNPSGHAWHARYGFGRVDAIAAARRVLPVAPVLTEGARSAADSGATAATEPAGLDTLVGVAAHVARTSGTRVRVQIEVEPVAPGGA